MGLPQDLDRDRPSKPEIPAPIGDRKGSRADLLLNLEAATKDLANGIVHVTRPETQRVRVILGPAPRFRAFLERVVLVHVWLRPFRIATIL